MRLLIGSPAFHDGGELPVEHTADGDDRSPALEWRGVPASAKSLALLVEDPDAPDPAAPKLTFCHWILVDLPTGSTGLPAGVGPAALPPGTHPGRNACGRTHWDGPAPPIGRHRYVFRLFALDTTLPSLRTPTRAELLAAIDGHVIEEARVTGTYARPARAGSRHGG